MKWILINTRLPEIKDLPFITVESDGKTMEFWEDSDFFDELTELEQLAFKAFMKVEYKEPGETTIDWDLLIKFFNKCFGKSSRIIPAKAKTAYKARLKEGFTKEDIVLAMKNAKDSEHHKTTNYQHCTLEFFSRADKLDKFSSMKPKVNQGNKSYTATAG